MPKEPHRKATNATAPTPWRVSWREHLLRVDVLARIRDARFAFIDFATPAGAGLKDFAPPEIVAKTGWKIRQPSYGIAKYRVWWLGEEGGYMQLMGATSPLNAALDVFDDLGRRLDPDVPSGEAVDRWAACLFERASEIGVEIATDSVPCAAHDGGTVQVGVRMILDGAGASLALMQRLDEEERAALRSRGGAPRKGTKIYDSLDYIDKKGRGMKSAAIARELRRLKIDMKATDSTVRSILSRWRKKKYLQQVFGDPPKTMRDAEGVNTIE